MLCNLCSSKVMAPHQTWHECPECGAVYLGPATPEFYDSSNAEQHLMEYRTDIGRRLNTLRLGLLMACAAPGSCVVDVGSSVGGFLATARADYTMFGVEINKDARSISSAVVAPGVPVY